MDAELDSERLRDAFLRKAPDRRAKRSGNNRLYYNDFFETTNPTNLILLSGAAGSESPAILLPETHDRQICAEQSAVRLNLGKD